MWSACPQAELFLHFPRTMRHLAAHPQDWPLPLPCSVHACSQVSLCRSCPCLIPCWWTGNQAFLSMTHFARWALMQFGKPQRLWKALLIFAIASDFHCRSYVMQVNGSGRNWGHAVPPSFLSTSGPSPLWNFICHTVIDVSVNAQAWWCLLVQGVDIG